MIKRLNLIFEQEEFKELSVTKNRSGLTWEKFILQKCLKEDE
jgi:hypothetical protein